MSDDRDSITSEKTWFSIKEAAEFLQVSEPTIFRWMKEGKLSVYKVGKSTRFTRDTLEAMVKKETGTNEAELHRAKCAACGHSELLEGELQGTGKLYFHLKEQKFWTLSTSNIPTTAKVCAACGYIQIHADPEKLEKLRKETDA